jgi:Na+-transporting NADH:ubiquinone oxidoreductase subunit E
MTHLLEIVLRAMLVENLALVFLLGMCTYIAVSKRIETAIGLGIAVVVVQLITVPVNNLLYEYLLAPGALAWAGLPTLDLSFLALVTFIGVIAALVQVLELVLER